MSTVLTINGITIDRVANRIIILSCKTFAKDGFSELRFARDGIILGSAIDPYAAKSCTLTQDGVLIFAGDVAMYTDQTGGLGWFREFTALGLSKRAQYVPITDSNSLTDISRFNTAQDDTDDIPSRDGRTMGQICLDVLEMSANKTALSAYGIGNYTSSGTAATATCTVASGVVQATFVVTNGGTGYTTAPTVRLSGGGGTGATATAAVASGIVTSLTRTAAGSGYLSPPIVIISTLPAITLADLDALAIIPPFEISVSGEKILEAIEGAVQTCHPNHFVQVDPAGNIRILDPRGFANDISAVLNPGGTGRWAMPTVTADWSSCFQRCIVRGNEYVLPNVLSLLPFHGSALADGGLAEHFAHDGLTNAQAKSAYNPLIDFISPTQSPGTAVGLAAIGSGAVTGISVSWAGYGYASAPTVLISGGGGTGATATAGIASGVVTGFTVTAAGSGYTTVPAVTCTGPAVGQQVIGTCTMGSTTAVTITSADASTNFSANWWDQTVTGHHGWLTLCSDILTDYTQKFTARVVANTAMTAGGTCVLTLDSPAPATNYTSFILTGTAGGASNVYRLYQITNASIAARIANYFPYPVARPNSDGTAATLTSTACGVVLGPNGQQSQIGIRVDPQSGTVLTDKPTCLVFSADGVTIVPVTDIQVFLPVVTGLLSTVYPPDSGGPVYAGTSHSVLGLTRTRTITVPDWRDYSNATNMNLLASEELDTSKDIVYEGSIAYNGCLNAALLVGHKITITATDWSTPAGWAALPIVAAELVYNERTGGTNYTTVLSFSNRRAPYQGAVLIRPAITGQAFGNASAALDAQGHAGTPDVAGTFGGMSMNESGEMEFHGGTAQQSLGETMGQFGSKFSGTGQAGDAWQGHGPLAPTGPMGPAIPTSPLQALAMAGANPFGPQVPTTPLQSLAMQGADPFGGLNPAFTAMAQGHAQTQGQGTGNARLDAINKKMQAHAGDDVEDEGPDGH